MPTPQTTHRDARILALASEGLRLREIRDRLAAEDARWAMTEGALSRIMRRLGVARRAGRRSDAGKPRAAIPEGGLAMAVALKTGLAQDALAESAQGDGKVRIARPGKRVTEAVSSRDALRELSHRGVSLNVSPGHFNRLLREKFNIHQRGAEARRTGPEVVRRFEAGRAMERVQFDGTLLEQFYIDASGDLRYLPDTEIKQQLKVEGRTRAYLLCFVDDHSRCMRLRACDGETARNTLTFLRAMVTAPVSPSMPSPNSMPRCLDASMPSGSNPMHGLPSVLYGDNGSALRSATLRAACDRLGITIVTHAPRAAWSKGKVEAGLNRRRSLQALVRGKRFDSLAELDAWAQSLADELNHRPMDALHGATPASVFAASAARSAAEGRWRYAPADDALWRRLAMVRHEGVRVGADCVVSIAASRGPERIMLPLVRPFVDWIGRRITLMLDPGDAAAPANALQRTAVVMSPDLSAEYEVPRVAPETYRTLLNRPIPQTGAAEFLAEVRALVRSGAMQGDFGAWIGQEAAQYAAIPGRVVELDAAAGQPLAAAGLISRRQAEHEMLAAWGEVRHDLLDEIFSGADADDATALRAAFARLLLGEAA